MGSSIHYTPALMKRFTLLTVSLAFALLLLVGCGQPELRTIGGEEGWTLETIPIPFSGTSKMGKVDNDRYRYYRYDSEEEAEADRKKVSPNGKTIDGVPYEWGGSIHFFQRLKRNIIYIGDNELTLGKIQREFGTRFAGTDSEE